MIKLPDGCLLDMRWKSVHYIRKDDQIVFEIIPMCDGTDIVVVPSESAWNGKCEIGFDGRNEMVFLIEQINWNRDIRFAELNVPPIVLPPEDRYIAAGSLESTPGGIEFAKKALFDPSQILDKEQAKEIYFTLETRFAEGASGNIRIAKEGIVPGSVFEKYSYISCPDWQTLVTAGFLGLFRGARRAPFQAVFQDFW